MYKTLCSIPSQAHGLYKCKQNKGELGLVKEIFVAGAEDKGWREHWQDDSAGET